MNNKTNNITDSLLGYQVSKFQGLIEETVQCCQTRTAWLSDRFGIPQAELKCLNLFMEERYLTVKGIARKLEVSKSRVTKILEGLLQKKLVDSIEDPRDGRVKLIALTHEGRSKSEEIESINRDLHRQIILDLSPKDRKTVLSALEMLRSSMETVKKQLV